MTREPTTPITFKSRDDWLKARANSVGASESRILYGLGYEDESVAGLIAEKKTGKRRTIDDDTQRKFDIATKLEPFVAEMFADEAKVELIRRVPVDDFLMWRLGVLSATPDYRSLPTVDVPRSVPVELKCVESQFAKDWDRDTPPLFVQTQLQQQMFCMGVNHGYVAALIGNSDFRWFRMDRNDNFVADLVKRVEAFWRKFIINDDPPPLFEGKAQSIAKAIRLLHPNDNGLTVNLPEVTTELHGLRTYAKREAKYWDGVADDCDNVIRLMIGDNTFGRLPDGSMYSHKTIKSRRTLVECESCGAVEISEPATTRRLYHHEKGLETDVVNETPNPRLEHDANRIIDAVDLRRRVERNGKETDEAS